VSTPEAAPHLLRPLVWRTHAAECSHGRGITANVHRNHGNTRYQLRGSRGEQEGDRAAVAVSDQMHGLAAPRGEQRSQVRDVLIEHRRGEAAIVRRPSKASAVIDDRPTTVGCCRKESIPGAG
jgi:hypothetical protein